MDGKVLAWNWVDLTVGDINEGFGIDENGATVTDESVWTGTLSSGDPYDSTAPGDFCNDWTSNESFYSGMTGRSSTRSSWSESGGMSLCSSSYRLFCFEQ